VFTKSKIYNFKVVNWAVPEKMLTYVPLHANKSGCFNAVSKGLETYRVLESRGSAKDEIFDILEERLSIFALLSEFGGGVKLLDVLFKVLCAGLNEGKVYYQDETSYRAVGPGFQGAVIAGFNGFNYRHRTP
jgi:hypothetical protein